ncbi:rCG21155, isoform CRA_d [Rattus norvegicus]|uniref:RCG21155, isoform CRA_d n=1 Tax=Rattus norvegicus TaxID=10116 RepID=A6J0F6_RAT|nr:rCG21155, isoform CRA_d [Rattus norvegicus]
MAASGDILFFFFFFWFFFSELGTEPRALRFLGKRSTTELNPQPPASLRCSGSATQTRSRTSLPGASTASFLLCTLPSSVGPELSCSCTPRTRSSWS